MSEEPEIVPVETASKKRGRPKGAGNKKKDVYIHDEKKEDVAETILARKGDAKHVELPRGDDDPEVAKIKARLFRMYINNAGPVEKAIDIVSNGMDAISQLDMMSYEDLQLVEKAARIEDSKKLDSIMIKSACSQTAGNIDAFFKFDGHFKKSIEESKGIEMYAKDAISDSFVATLPAWAKLGMATASYMYDAWTKSHPMVGNKVPEKAKEEHDDDEEM